MAWPDLTTAYPFVYSIVEVMMCFLFLVILRHGF